MFKECRFIMPSGYKCKAPALRDQQFCYFHTASRHYANYQSSSAESIPFPSIEDTKGIQIALNQVIRHLGTGRLDRRQAGVLFYGLQIASRIATRSDQKPGEAVRELCEDRSLDYTPANCILAPETSTCEPPGDCVNCSRRDLCPDFELWESDVEELEERLQAERDPSEESEPEARS